MLVLLHTFFSSRFLPEKYKKGVTENITTKDAIPQVSLCFATVSSFQF